MDREVSAIKGVLCYISEGWIRSDFCSLDNNIPGDNHDANLLLIACDGHIQKDVIATFSLGSDFSILPLLTMLSCLHKAQFPIMPKRVLLLCSKALENQITRPTSISCSAFLTTEVKFSIIRSQKSPNSTHVSRISVH